MRIPRHLLTNFLDRYIYINLSFFFIFSVPSIVNGLSTESEDLNTSQDYLIKCPQCQKGCQTFQSLKEHMGACHQTDLGAAPENGTVIGLSTPPGAAISPAPLGTGGPFACSQCATSFPNKDQLEKHELLHSPNAQVVRPKIYFIRIYLMCIYVRVSFFIVYTCILFISDGKEVSRGAFN